MAPSTQQSSPFSGDEANSDESTLPNARPQPSTAKWGAACASCATAKAKCIRSNPQSGAKCDRCERLFKDCAAQVHRPRKKRVAKPSKTVQLENKLNDLYSLFKHGELKNGDVDEDKLGTLLDPCVSATSRKPSASPVDSDRDWTVPKEYNSRAPPSCICRLDGGHVPPIPDSDETLLDTYRRELVPVHPFVVVPATTSAAQLKTERPFLMSAIRMVASFRSLRSMRAQMYYLMQQISERMLIQSERSLDLLLGIIVIIGYYQYHCFTHAQISNLIMMAQALAGDLGLKSMPTRSERSTLMMVKPLDVQPRTNEERRALAGVWFLSSALALGFGKTESMRYTRYLDQCVQELATGLEYETDVMLMNLVRVQYLSDRISRFNVQDHSTDEMPLFSTAQVSRTSYVAAFQAELDELRQKLPLELKVNRILQAHINSAVLRLYAPPIIDSNLVHQMAECLTTPPDGGCSPLEELYRSRNALIDWFENWLAIPTSSYYCQTTATCSLIVHACSMLGRWAKLIAPTKAHNIDTNLSHEDLREDCHSSPSSKGPSRGATSALTPAPSDSSAEKEPCEHNHPLRQKDSDPSLPVAVVNLQSRLKRQSGLHIDVPSILCTIQTRFKQVSTTLQSRSLDRSAADDPNIWGMSAAKMLILRSKLEQWADLVVAGTEALSLEDRGPHDAVMGDVGGSLMDMNNAFARDLYVPGFDFGADAWGDPNGWLMDMCVFGEGGVNPFDGNGLDWDPMVVNSVGSVEHVTHGDGPLYQG
ncbi:putative C6 transcription factor [Emericellopsis atlantica]|uniref:C6 transcription factor n=1 Tax=Emericellopsis atlantica TaxID=2614577 RepID=A0A9P8CSS4_9HYPO|nr:putative C6 transcription factor [Emericellopsis atlantica]KAG9258133.1 putative C6 transcription factor [Emericellopsis atlantica]